MNVWQQFFNGFAPQYLNEGFTKNTKAEIEFLVELLQLNAGASILDMGCGVGRHAVPLARLGYAVTGVDLSDGMLAEGKKAAQVAGVEVEWIHCDATRFEATMRFDAAICLCEGAFGLIEAGADGDKHDQAILWNIHAALKPGAPFVLTALNGFRGIREFTQADVESGRFDPPTLVETSTMEWESPEGTRSVTIQQKKHLPQELARLSREVGFTVEHLWGGTAGKWDRRPIDLDEMEMMLVLRKV